MDPVTGVSFLQAGMMSHLIMTLLSVERDGTVYAVNTHLYCGNIVITSNENRRAFCEYGIITCSMACLIEGT